MPLRPFVTIPKDLREWTRWCREQEINAEIASITTAQLQDSAVTLAKFQDVTADRILGRLSSAGVLQELTAAQVVSLLEAVDWAFSGDIGFHGSAATAQQTSPSTVTITPVSGTGDDATINSNLNGIRDAVNAIKTALDNKGLTG